MYTRGNLLIETKEMMLKRIGDELVEWSQEIRRSGLDTRNKRHYCLHDFFGKRNILVSTYRQWCRESPEFKENLEEAKIWLALHLFAGAVEWQFSDKAINNCLVKLDDKYINLEYDYKNRNKKVQHDSSKETVVVIRR